MIYNSIIISVVLYTWVINFTYVEVRLTFVKLTHISTSISFKSMLLFCKLFASTCKSFLEYFDSKLRSQYQTKAND